MKIKQLLGLLAILIALVAVVLILENPFAKDERTKKIETAEKLFPNFNAENVNKIELIANSETTTLEKNGDQWLVASMENYPADQDGVTKILEKVADLKAIDRISKNPDKQIEFEVDSSGVEAKFYSSNDLIADLFIGKTTPSFLDSYVRSANSDHVYIGKGLNKSDFDKGSRSWRNRKIFDFDKNSITEVKITEKDQDEIILNKSDDGKWQISAPIESPAKVDVIDQIANSLSSIEADDFVENSEFESIALITATLNDGSKKALMIASETDGKFNVKRDDNDQIFSINAWRRNQLFKSIDELKTEAEIADPEPK